MSQRSGGRDEDDTPSGGQRWADFCPTKDWSPAGTDSTRADSEASSPTRSQGQTPSQQAAAHANLCNVKLNLFEHLSPPMPTTGAAPTTPMLPAVPATAPWEFPAPMSAMPVIQFTADQQAQQPCAYTMACG